MHTFFFHALQNFKTTGSFVPSGRALCEALISPIYKFNQANVLEVGSGEGVVARHLLNQTQAEPDRLKSLWVNELDDALLNQCQHSVEPQVLRTHPNTQTVFSAGAYELMTHPDKHFDLIISSLPLNSLPCDDVEAILTRFKQALSLHANSALCFYEYLGSRFANSVHAALSEETAFSEVLSSVFADADCSSKLVLKNFPPARVWCIRPY